MGYDGMVLKKSITLSKIYSIHYFEYCSDFKFKGESHDFWEFLLVDKGEVGITAGDKFFILKKGHIVFHQPNEFHNVKALGKFAPNLIVISFDCKSTAMNFFKTRILKIDGVEQNLLANIIIEARQCFDCPINDPHIENMPLKKQTAFGSQQLLLLYLEQFLIHIIRRYSNAALHRHPSGTELTKITKNKRNSETFSLIVDYLEQNISNQVSINNICQHNHISRSQLLKLFKEQTSMGVIEYFLHLKIDIAKELIRTNKMNFSQIAEYLGYSSIHYFSRQFRKMTGMTPTEYSSSIKAMADGGLQHNCRQ